MNSICAELSEFEEIADVVASARASFITGANVLVDLGATTGIQI